MTGIVSIGLSSRYFEIRLHPTLLLITAISPTECDIRYQYQHYERMSGRDKLDFKIYIITWLAIRVSNRGTKDMVSNSSNIVLWLVFDLDNGIARLTKTPCNCAR